METEQTTVQTPDTPADPAMDEHRAAFAKMRCDWALEQLYAASGAHDPAVLRRLIDIGEGDIVLGEDGVPDVTAVKEKIEHLRREQAYLFRDAKETQSAASGGDGERLSGSMRLGVMTQTELGALDDAAYYRAVMAKKGRRR